MAPDNTQPLQHLRDDVLQELVGLSDFIAGDEDSSYELLLILARNTGNVQLLGKAFAKIKQIEDPRQKSDALLALLDEVELSLGTTPAPQDDGTTTPEGQPPVETSDSNPE